MPFTVINQELENILLNPQELPDIFVVVNKKDDGFVDSVSIFIFDEKKVLHVVDSVDPEVPHTYNLRVPVKNKRGDFVGTLYETAVLDEGDRVTGNSRLGDELYTYTKEHFNHMGDFLSAQRSYCSEEITNALKEASIDFPIVYFIQGEDDILYDHFSSPKPENINIKSSLKGRKVTLTSLLNIFPIIAKERNRSIKPPLADHYNLFDFIFGSLAVLIAHQLLFDDVREQNEFSIVVIIFLCLAGFYLTGKSIFGFAVNRSAPNEEELKHLSSIRGRIFLRERTRKNKYLDELSVQMAENESRQAGEDLESPEACGRRQNLRLWLNGRS